MSEAEYLEVARNDPAWRDVVASMKISGFTLDIETEILAAKMIVGNVGFSEIVQIVKMQSKSFAGGSQTPTKKFEA